MFCTRLFPERRPFSLRAGSRLRNDFQVEEPRIPGEPFPGDSGGLRAHPAQGGGAPGESQGRPGGAEVCGLQTLLGSSGEWRGGGLRLMKLFSPPDVCSQQPPGADAGSVHRELHPGLHRSPQEGLPLLDPGQRPHRGEVRGPAFTPPHPSCLPLLHLCPSLPQLHRVHRELPRPLWFPWRVRR